MTTASAPPAQAPRSALAARRRAVGDTTFRFLTLLCGLLVLVILALIAVSSTGKALPAFRAEGLSFFTSKVWDPGNGKFGSLAFVYGTIVTSIIAIAIGVPVSIGIALTLNEVAPRR